MIRNIAVLNSDTVNRYGFRFAVKALEDALEQKALEGVPTCLGHDMHKPLGWTIPFGLYFEPGMCRLVGNTFIAEKDTEQKFINDAHTAALYKRYEKECNPYIEEFKKIVEQFLTADAKYLYAGCVCYRDNTILEKIYPDLFEKQDKNGLIYLSDLFKNFTYLGHGVFKDNNSELAVIAHPYFRKSLSIHNNLNYYFLDELIRQSANDKIAVRIALDRDIVGLAKTYLPPLELEYWRGPKFNNDVSKIKTGVSVYVSTEFQKLYYGISQTEFWWKIQDGIQTLEAEELKEHPSNGINNDSYGCRYVHSKFDEANNAFEHFDGAIRMYDTEKMLMRIDNDIKHAGKNSVYTKLFRIDGQLSIADWKTLVCHYFQNNPLIHEYFNVEPETDIEPHIVEEKTNNMIEKLVPFSMNADNGIRLFVSYHPIENREEKLTEERCISGYDVFSIGETSLRVIETDVIEVKKALQRLGSDLDLPKNVSLACSEDMYWNIPTIHHRLNANLQKNISQTLDALKMILEKLVSNEKDKIISFSICWERDTERQVTVSVMGHCKDILTWLKDNNKIPIENDAFRDWLEKQSVFINKYPIKRDKPALFEMVHSDGVLYIRRRCIAPEIKYQLKPDVEGRLLIGFAFTQDQFDLAMAYKERKIDVALGYIHKKLECSVCKSDYTTCEHSTILDENVSVTVVDFELINIVWTDRKA